jgi:carbonic anhydrase
MLHMALRGSPSYTPINYHFLAWEDDMYAYIRWIILATIVVSAAPVAAQDAKPTPASALQRLKDGNDRFAADMPAKRDVGKDRRAELAKGQHPFAVVLTCADSRVAPELLFDTGLGDLFVLRVAGNIADPAVVGSIEYAVEHLHAPLIVVLGHENCGAVAAAIDGKPIPGDLGWLVKQIKLGDKLPADKDAKLAAGVRNNAEAAAADLLTRSKVITEEVKNKKVAIVSGVYSLKTGKVEWTTAAEKKAPEPKRLLGSGSFRLETPPAATAPMDDPPGPFVARARFPRLRALIGRR